jgi:hypothetical protein
LLQIPFRQIKANSFNANQKNDFVSRQQKINSVIYLCNFISKMEKKISFLCKKTLLWIEPENFPLGI